MQFVACYKWLIVPSRRTISLGSKIPQAEFRRVVSHPVNTFPSQTYFPFPCFLIKVTVYSRFKCMWLVYHLRDGTNPFKIGTICPDSINPYISDEQPSMDLKIGRYDVSRTPFWYFPPWQIRRSRPLLMPP
jgi:hypothetical protein